MNEIPNSMQKQEPVRISRRDLEMLQYNRELMRRASLTGPSTMLMGADLPMIRTFAQETFMQMSNMHPDQFKGKTVRDWEDAIKAFIQSRRPEFKSEILTKMKARYAEGGDVPNIVLSKSLEQEGMQQKKASVLDVLLSESFGVVGLSE